MILKAAGARESITGVRERGETMVRRPIMNIAQWLGIALMIPGLLRVPLPQADFHIIRHHHGAGETCPQHDHLLRWHPQADEAEDVAVFHWHWFLPHSLDSALSADRGEAPVLHAHDGDQFLECFWSPSPASPVDARDGIPGRFDPGSPLDFVCIDAARIASPPLWSAEGRPNPWTEHEDDAPLARLVRWNC